MKIAFLFPQNIIGGGALVVYEHAQHLKKCGHDVLIIYREFRKNRDNGFAKEYGIDYLIFDNIDVAALKFDVIIATWWETFYDIFLLNADNYFYLSQDDERRFYEDKNSFKVKFCDLTYRFPHIGIITISSWWQKALVEEGNKHTKVVVNGYNHQLFNDSRRAPEENEKLRVLIEGPGDTWFRRIDDCFQAVNNIEGIEVWFKSRGDFIKPSWKYDKVFYSVSSEEMANIYSQCDVLLKMSEVEAFCLPNLEMMACGGTIITTNFTGHEEYAIDGFNSTVIPIGDINAARNAIVKLRDDKALLAHLKSNALKTAQSMTWDESHKKFEQALDELVTDFKDYDYTGLKRELIRLREIKLQLDIFEKQKEKLNTDYESLFYQFHRNEYRAVRFLGRLVYSIPFLGNLIRYVFRRI